MATIQPNTQPARWVVSLAGIVECDGITFVGELTGVNPDYDATFAEGDNAFAKEAQAVVAMFPPLPAAGWLEQDAIYQHAGQAVIVRQSHWRTEHEPSDVPALFLVYREDAVDELSWIAGEQVYAGTLRTFDGMTYRARQGHVTQSDWTPPATPALWEVITAEPPQPWVQPTGAHDAYPAGAQVTYGGFIWESTIDANVWEPGVYGWVQI